MADLVANLPSSFGTSCSVGAYFTTLDLWRKKGEGFNLESSTDIQAALSEEVGRSKKGFTCRSVPERIEGGLLFHWNPHLQLT